MSSQFSMHVGIVKNNADPAQHGRLQVYIPALDSTDFEVSDLPWAEYVSPFGGVTANFKVGPEQEEIPGVTAYGFWAIPKNGAQVLCGFLEGDTNRRFWLGCFYMPEMNRTLPQSVNDIKTELDESGSYPQTEIPHYRRNLDEAGLQPGSLHYKTRGGHQRSVSYPANGTENKDSTDGYAPKNLEPEKSDSQTVCWTSPGRHYIAMSDVADECRIRIKSTMGNQIILDDTNERIYISTAKGRNYIEIDEGSGKIYFYTAGKFSVHSENDLNLYSSENINIVAKKRVNIQSEERGVKIQAKMGVSAISEAADVNLTASRDVVIKTTNGPTAGAVSDSTSCSVGPYAGRAIGLIRNYAEPAGSSTSRISINAVQGVDVRADTQSIMITAGTTLDLRTVAGDLTIHSAAGLNNRASIYRSTPAPGATFGGSAQVARTVSGASAERIKIKMVIPKHEPWVRDEDEGQCKTPRNSRYQG